MTVAFNIRGENPSTSPPDFIGNEGHVEGFNYAIDNPDCELATKLIADDWNFVVCQFRHAATELGINIEDPDDCSILLRLLQHTIVVTGQDPERVPIANFDQIRVRQDTSLQTNLVQNDSDAIGATLRITGIGDNESISVGESQTVEQGTVRLIDNQNVVVTPPNGFTGVYQFPYTLTNDIGRSASAFVEVTVFDPGPCPGTTPIGSIQEIRWRVGTATSTFWQGRPGAPRWGIMREFNAAELAEATNGNTTTRAKLLSGSGNVMWLAWDMGSPQLLQSAQIHPAGRFTPSGYRLVGQYYNNIYGSNNGNDWTLLPDEYSVTGNTAPVKHTIDLSANSCAEYRYYLKSFNFRNGAEFIDMSVFTLT